MYHTKASGHKSYSTTVYYFRIQLYTVTEMSWSGAPLCLLLWSLDLPPVSWWPGIWGCKCKSWGSRREIVPGETILWPRPATEARAAPPSCPQPGRWSPRGYWEWSWNINDSNACFGCRVLMICNTRNNVKVPSLLRLQITYVSKVSNPYVMRPRSLPKKTVTVTIL